MVDEVAKRIACQFKQDGWPRPITQVMSAEELDAVTLSLEKYASALREHLGQHGQEVLSSQVEDLLECDQLEGLLGKSRGYGLSDLARNELWIEPLVSVAVAGGTPWQHQPTLDDAGSGCGDHRQTSRTGSSSRPSQRRSFPPSCRGTCRQSRPCHGQANIVAKGRGGSSQNHPHAPRAHPLGAPQPLGQILDPYGRSHGLRGPIRLAG